MTTAIISGASAIAAAVITALITTFATLRSKKIDLLAQSEERKHSSLVRGYDTILAAADLGWHYRCHQVLMNYDINPPFDWENEFPNIQHRVEALFHRSIDLLKTNSLHFEQISPSLQVIHQIVMDGKTVSFMEARPDDYEQARQLVIEMSRIDTRLEKPLKKKFWKSFSEENKPLGMDELAAEDRIRRAYAMLSEGKMGAYMEQGEDAILAFINDIQEKRRAFASSLSLTASRVEHWKDEEVVGKNTPCTISDEPCYKNTQRGASNDTPG